MLELVEWTQSELQTNEFSRSDIIKGTNLKARTVEETVKLLLSHKKIQRLGRGRSTRYRNIV